MDPVQDTFTFSPKVFLGKKGKNSVYNGPQLLLENLNLNETFDWTKAVVSIYSCVNIRPSRLNLHVYN